MCVGNSFIFIFIIDCTMMSFLVLINTFPCCNSSYSSVNDVFCVSNKGSIIIIVYLMKLLNSFLVEDATITIQGNGKICVNSRQKTTLYRMLHS